MTEIEKVYNPLKTRSGLPHLSQAQREFFEKQQVTFADSDAPYYTKEER